MAAMDLTTGAQPALHGHIVLTYRRYCGTGMAVNNVPAPLPAAPYYAIERQTDNYLPAGM